MFFGEDIFIAVASILLIVGFLATNGIVLAPLELSVWAIPSAVAAVMVHGGRLLWLDRRLMLSAPSPPREAERGEGRGGVFRCEGSVAPLVNFTDGDVPVEDTPPRPSPLSASRGGEGEERR